MKRSERIRKTADQIEKLLDENSSPIPNPSVVNQLKFLAGQVGGVDSYASEKAHWIASLADTYYSVRKHSTHPGGPDALLAEMWGMVKKLRAHARTREDHPDSDSF